MILEKSRTVRRRYQRRKQQVQFTKAELERLERSEERDRRAKKLQEQEKRRVANKKKKLEKEALAREERKKTGQPDPNANISSSQKLLSNFFGMKAGGAGGVRDKSESTGEDGGDTEVDSDDDCGSGKSATPGEGPECSEIRGIESDDSFGDDGALSLFNDENVLKEINSSGNADDALEPPTGKQAESTPTSRRISPCRDGSKPHVLSGQASGADKKQIADQLALIPATDANGDKEKEPSTTNVKLSSKTKEEIPECDAFEDDLFEEILQSGSASISPEAHVTVGTMQSPQETTACLYQDAEDVLAGLCTQDFDDDDVEEGSNKAPSPKPKLHDQRAPCDEKPVESTRPPLCDLAPTSLNTKKVETTTTSQKQIETSKNTLQPQTTTTTTINDEYGSFTFDDEDLLSLGV